MQFDNDGLPILYDRCDESSKRNIQNPIYTKDITAKEAKERADAFLQARENEDFKNIMYLITNAAENGEYKIYLDNGCNITLTDAIEDKLEQLGYNVEVTLIQDAHKFTIGWKVVISWEGEKEDGI